MEGIVDGLASGQLDPELIPEALIGLILNQTSTNEMGPTHCCATPTLTSHLTRSAPWPSHACRQLVLASCPLLDLMSGLSVGLHSQGAQTAPSWTWCLTVYTRRDLQLPPRELKCAGGGGGPGGQVTVSQGG